MPAEAMAVVGLPLSVVETQLWDVTQWPTFLAGLVAVRRSSHERYVFTVRQGRRDGEVLVAVRWQARDHRFTWRALEGPPWDGLLRLVPINGRRTRVFLQRRAHPRSFVASLVRQGAIAYGGRGKGAKGAGGRGAVTGPKGTATHGVVRRNGQLLLERVRFSCGCRRG